MKRKQIDWILLLVSIACFLIMSVSFLLMTMEDYPYLPGVMFWLGLAFGVALQITLAVRRRIYLKTNPPKTKKKWIGLLSFGSNIAAIVADISLAISVVAMILAFVFTKGYGYSCYVFIATTVFSFSMHCVLNGKIYFQIKN